MNKKKIFYISTPIYYANEKPHLGHLYSTLYADFVARFQRTQSKEVFFITGCDQHGSKIAKAAKKNKTNTETFIKTNTQHFLNLWKLTDISYTHFVETHNLKHQVFVVNVFNNFLKKKYLYLNYYQGLYCSVCESFLSDEQLLKDQKEEKCLVCQKKPIFLKEKNFFLKINDQDRNFLQKLFQQWKKKKEIGHNWTNSLNELLKIPKLDLSITRCRVEWAIKLSKQFPKHTAYVWFDALWSYISVLTTEERELIWKNNDSQIVHVLGKEITKFHLVYWPLFLEKDEWKKPDNFLIHGWILNDEQKMSKSIGNVVSPEEIIKKYGVNVLRIFIASLIKPHLDIKYSEELIENFYRTNLVNNFSNYIHRLLIMIEKYQPDFTQINKLKKQFQVKDLIWKKQLQTFIDQYHDLFNKFEISQALQIIFDLLNFGNQMIEKEKPWNLAKEKNIYLNFFLFNSLLNLKIVALLLKPFAISLSKQILKTLNLNNDESFNLDLNWETSFKLEKVVKFFE